MFKFFLCLLLLFSPIYSYASQNQIERKANLSEVQRECIFQASVEYARRSLVDLEKCSKSIDEITDYSIKELLKDMLSVIISSIGSPSASSKAFDSAIGILKNHVEKGIEKCGEAYKHLKSAKGNKIKSEALERCLWFDEIPYFDYNSDLTTNKKAYKKSLNLKSAVEKKHEKMSKHLFNFPGDEIVLDYFFLEPTSYRYWSPDLYASCGYFDWLDHLLYLGALKSNTLYSRQTMHIIKRILLESEFDPKIKKESLKIVDAFLNKKTVKKNKLNMLKKLYDELYKDYEVNLEESVFCDVDLHILLCFYKRELPIFELSSYYLAKKKPPSRTMISMYYTSLENAAYFAHKAKACDEPITKPEWIDYGNFYKRDK